MNQTHDHNADGLRGHFSARQISRHHADGLCSHADGLRGLSRHNADGLRGHFTAEQILAP